MKKRAVLLLFPIIAIVFEALPFGAVLRFSDPEATVIKTYSYFDLTPYGYANFGPFLTALLTIAILVFSVIYLLKPKKKLINAVTIISAVAALTSVMPLQFGTEYYNIVSVIVTLLIICDVSSSVLIKV